MPQYDLYHETVKRALEKDGWRITDDPFTIMFEGLRLFADLGAERIFAAEREAAKIVVEIKVLGKAGRLSEFEKALGQYRLYRLFLKRTSPQRQLFLAVTEEVYQDFFLRPPLKIVVLEEELKLLVFNHITEEVVQWIN